MSEFARCNAVPGRPGRCSDRDFAEMMSQRREMETSEEYMARLGLQCNKPAGHDGPPNCDRQHGCLAGTWTDDCPPDWWPDIQRLASLRGLIQKLSFWDSDDDVDQTIVAAVRDAESALTELELAGDSSGEKRRRHLENVVVWLAGAKQHIAEALELDSSDPKEK